MGTKTLYGLNRPKKASRLVFYSGAISGAMYVESNILGGIFVEYCHSMYGHAYSKSMDQPGMVACSWSADKGKRIIPCPRSRLRIWSPETDSVVPSRISLLISILRLNLVLTYTIPSEFRSRVHLFIQNRHTPSVQTRVYRVTQLRTNGVHCQESAGTGPVNLLSSFNYNHSVIQRRTKICPW